MNKVINLLIAVVLSLGAFAQVVTVTNTNDSGPGSLRQAIIDANANVAINEIRFNIPTSDPNYNASTGVYSITISSDSLPKINNRGLHINGNSQKAFTSNSNTYQFGTGGTVGIDNLTLSKIDGPEIQILDGGNFIYGFFITSDSVTVSGLAMNGFGRAWNNNNANIAFHSAHYGRIEGCVLGSRASVNSMPVVSDNGGNNFIFFDSDYAVITNNYVAYSDAMGGYFTFDCDHMTVYNNEFAQNAQQEFYTDGLDIAFQTSNGNVYGNLFRDNGGNGFDTYTAVGSHNFHNNTATRNGRKNQETAGVRVYGDGNTYSKNRIFDNYGAGIMITSTAINMTMSQNSIYGNGSISQLPAQPWPTETYQIGIDLLSASDDHGRGTSPFVTKNDIGDADGGGNNLINFPVIESATKVGGNLILKGFAPAGATIEFFIGDLYPGATWPQGKTFLFAKTEGGVDDADNTTGSYGPANINGYAQGENTNANRFMFTVPMPAGVSVNTVLTATATVSGSGTSEFGGGATVVNPGLIPTLNCVYVKGNGDYVAKFGYVNTTSSTINKSIGPDNNFSPAPQDRGQGTSFAPGTHNNVVSITFSSGNITWNLDGTSVTASAASARCDADLELTQTVTNNAPTTGSNVTFTLTLTNHSVDIPQSGIQVNYTLDSNFVYVSNTPASGSYSHNGTTNSGVWSIPELLPGQSTTLQVVVTINGNGAAVGVVNVSNQVDNNSTNNSATENITTGGGGSSGGNGGGIESNGSMAEKIAHRNYIRQKTGHTEKAFYANLNALPTLAEHKMSQLGKTNSLTDYIPNSIPQSSRSVVTTPTDLIGITNAINIFSADYYNSINNRLGVVLAMETGNNAVYEHTKIVCDRLRGGHLEEISTVTVDGHNFRMVKLAQENGGIDYAVSFVVFEKSNGDFIVDQKWNLTEYNIPASTKIYNFQVWTISPSLTKSAMESILNLFKQDGNVSYLNHSAPVIPSVYVINGDYRGGKLYLTLNNSIGASQITVAANLSKTEVSGGRQDVVTHVALPANVAQPTVEVNVGYLFDVDFTVVNNRGGGTDKLYFADGPWGRDWETQGVQNASLYVSEETNAQQTADIYPLERDATFNGRVLTYATLYKQLRAGARPTDISGFNQVVFEASATGITTIEVTIVRESITTWSQQFRKNITVDGSLREYSIDFADFASTMGGSLWADDIVSINFAIKGDNQNYTAANMQIKDIRFTKSGRIGLDENRTAVQSFEIQPNPFVGKTQFNFELEERENIAVEVYDLSGRLVSFIEAADYEVGQNSISFEANANMKAGVYIVKLISDRQTRTARMIMAR